MRREIPVRPWPRVLAELCALSFTGRDAATGGAPHVRAAVSCVSLQRCFVIASLPAALVGVWNLGEQTAIAAAGDAARLAGWQGSLAGALGLAGAAAGWPARLLLGATYWLPLLLVSLAVAAFWEVVFATRRRRPVDGAWLMTAWLFGLLLPPAVSPLLAAVALSFGAVVGGHIFGGTGKYLVSPALLGVLFLHFSYPGFTDAALPVVGQAAVTTWATLVAGAGDIGLVPSALGYELGAVGAGSALACLAGAAYLVHAGAASWRVLAGVVLGVLLAGSSANAFGPEEPTWQLPWFWHLALGNLAFGAAFLATDPSIGPLTRPGRWGYGLLIGLLAVAIRVLDPSHPEGSLFALLLASLTVPLLDHLAVRRYRRASGAALASGNGDA